MTTSGTITATLTARQVGTKAMQKIGIISLGETPTDDEAIDVMSDLSLMLKSWQASTSLWRLEEETLTATTRETVLDPRCIDVAEARLTTSYERPLARWEWADYVNIPTKAQVGQPSCYSFRRTRDTAVLLLWPSPSVSRPALITYTAARVIEDVTDLEQTLDVPQEWLECVILNLAVRIAPSFGADVSSEVTGRAAQLLTQMQDLDRPSSIYMGA